MIDYQKYKECAEILIEIINNSTVLSLRDGFKCAEVEYNGDIFVFEFDNMSFIKIYSIYTKTDRHSLCYRFCREEFDKIHTAFTTKCMEIIKCNYEIPSSLVPPTFKRNKALENLMK